MAETQENTGELGWPEFIKKRMSISITNASVNERLDFLNHSLLIRLRRKGFLFVSLNKIGTPFFSNQLSFFFIP
jgi:hypothetical protein